MKIFAPTVTSSWTSEMVTRFARSAGMIDALEGRSGVYASGGRQRTFILSYTRYPLFKRIEASRHQTLGNGRRFQ
jgi:hypothetical protein